MNLTLRKFWVCALLGLLPSAQTPALGLQTDNGAHNYAAGHHGAAATGSRQGCDAAVEMLRSGGNAIDAAITSMLLQSVVESSLFCFGSEVPIIVYDANRDVVEVIAGLGAAPRLATPEWFREHRQGLIQGRGDVANAVVPGFLDACLTALDRYGTRSFSDCAAPMLVELRYRSQLTPDQLLRERRGVRDPQAWLDHHRNFFHLIERLVAAEAAAGPDRRSGLLAVSDYFYRGPVARELDAWSRANGGLLRYTDFAQHHTRIDQPLAIQFRGHTIYKCGVWTQGPFLLQTLRLLESYDLEQLKYHSADHVHLVVEAMKLAFADRDAFYGDPEFVEVPIATLLADDYTAMRRELIDANHASTEQQSGDPFQMQPLLGYPPQDHQVTSGHSSDTTNCLVADRWGNVVAATPSGWGGVIAGDTGVELGSRMIGLNTWENHPSIVAPGKRPRITLTPTLVMKEGRPVMAVSVAGGDQQDQASIQIILNRLIFGLDSRSAVANARFSTEHHINWFGHLPARPGSLLLPEGIDATARGELQQRGHMVSDARTAGAAVLLVIDPETGEKQAAGDRNRNTAAY